MCVAAMACFVFKFIDNAMPKTFVLHDETVNTYGFRMLTSGCDLTELKKNPVMLLNHNDWNLPIGRWENIRIEGSQILADAVFDLEDKRENGGASIASKVERDFLRMASIGAWPPDEVSDDVVFKVSGQTRPTVTRWKAREASIVTIGSNHNALAFYDKEGQLIDLTDLSEVIKLMDNAQKSFSNKEQMNELNQILKLSDSATAAEQATAMRNIISERDRLKTENVTLSDAMDQHNKAAKEKKQSEAIALVDAAVKDGRIDAKLKDNYIKLFDVDFDNTKATIEGLPKRKSVAAQIAEGNEGNNVELADLQKKTWEELDKAGKLTMLRDKHYDVYEQKFEEKFGVKPQKA